MRLVEIYKKLINAKNVFDNIKGKPIILNNTTTGYEISSWISVSDTLLELKELKLYSNEIEEIFKLNNVINFRTNIVSLDSGTYNIFIKNIERMKIAMYGSIELLKSQDYGVFIDVNQASIDISIPETISIKQLSDMCDEFDKIFSLCPIIDEEVKFVGTEKGSILVLFLVSTHCAKIVGQLVNAALDIQRKIYQNKMFKVKLQTMEGLGDAINNIIKNFDKEAQDLRLDVSKKLAEQNERNLKPEDLTRLSNTIKMLEGLIEKGVQMQCTLAEGQEIKEIQFPKPEEYKALIEGIKMISDGQNSN